MMKPDENEDLPAFRRKLPNALFEQGNLLFGPDYGFDGRAGVGRVNRYAGIGQGRPMLLTTVMVDDKIRGNPKEKGARIQKGLSRRCLEQTQEGILHEVLGRLRTSNSARQKMLQIAPMLFDQCGEFSVC